MEHNQYNGGTIREDDQLHAVTRAGTARYALCLKGRISHTVPAPFVPGGDGSCWTCADKVRRGLDLMD
jgi:hypothetical protein